MKRSGWNWRKSLALLLSIIMMVGLLPLSAFAEEGEDAADSVAVGEASTPIETTETMPAQDESAEETPVPASPIEETSEPTEPEETPEPAEPEETPAPTMEPTPEPTGTPDPTEPEETPAPTEPEETPAPTEAPEATEAPTEAPTATNAPAEEPIETPALTMEPTSEPTGTPEPTPIPTPDYIFEQETVYLTEILEAVKKTITENSTLSVDCDSIRLSETEVEIEDEEKQNLDRITVTVTDVFLFATLTITSGQNEMQTITMAYPEERKPIALSHTFTGENDAVSLRALLKGNGIETKAFDSYTVTDGDASAMELVDQDDDLLIAQIAAFDRAVLSVVTVDRQQITLTLYGWKADESPAQEQPQAEPGKITLESTDGETYLVRVTYENDAGLPMGSTALYVKPIRESELRFGAYLNAAAKTLGLKTKDIELSRVFDIKIVDANNPKMVFEPKGEVEVSITLLDTDLCQYGKVSVLHFVENAHSGDVAVDKRVNTVEGETVSFTTDGFSVYVIVGDETPRRTYYFYTLDEYLDYTEYILYTDEGESTTKQTIKNGETVVVPANPVNPQDPDATFAGWYKGGSDPTHPNMEANPYDFDNIPAVTQSEVVYLYAQFKSYAYVVFHGQYDSTSETYPVAITRRAELINGSAEVNISDCSVAYTGAGNSYVFSAWAKEPVREPNGTMSEYGSPVAIITVEPDASGNITITKTTHLYPLYTPVYWLSSIPVPSAPAQPTIRRRTFTTASVRRR